MEEMLFFVSLIGFSLASISDLKTREVPDYLSYSLIGLGVLYRILWSASLFPDELFISVLTIPALVSLLFGIFSYLLYKTGQWGGGDVKLMIAAAWLLGFFPSREMGLLGMGFFINFFMNLIIFGTLYTVLFTIGKGLVMGGIEKIRKLMLIIGAFLGIIFMVLLKDLPTSISLLIPLTFLAGFGIPFFKQAEEVCFTKGVHPSKLTEGDWLIEDIKGIPKRGEGLTIGDIKKINKMKIKKVKIKEGVPFLPAFLISLIVTWAGVYFLPISW